MSFPRITLDKQLKRRNHDPINFHGTTKTILTKNGKEKQNSGKKQAKELFGCQQSDICRNIGEQLQQRRVAIRLISE